VLIWEEDNIKKILMGVMIALCFFMPQPLFAGGESTQFTMTPRAQKIFDQAPQTPEALLKVVKEFLDTPKMNGYEFGEKVSGIDREHWGEPSTVPYKNSHFLMYFPFGTHSPYHYRNQKLTPPTAYVSSNIKISQDRLLHDLIVDMVGENFCLSPLIVQKVLGKPTKINVMTPCHEFASCYTVLYFYTKNGYVIRITYPAKDIPFNYDDLCESGFVKNTEARVKTKKELASFENHKNICATILRIYRKN